ncbi:STAS domain-containing protein [Desulfolutivibrio sulfoxidireducens]|uniref:STAS domain-containing protein n=1 Tax=Desulfolutivibrio sulfoxidireducens TaxID=2773299 RepID=UPI00159D29D6|nr:STAS domain-containing protein [Desulfolutivibrio sulfoxidireducens]QLA17616.1 STAS domain-containing protein [Desulfolutivibrio sulfoxidireducens]QLA21192.1 STAS domain-containing protein [Desulfolutivibrio sulfoxidireducens]
MRIDLDGDCTVAAARVLKDLFLDALARGEPTRVSFRGIDKADLSFFELLLAARQAFAQKGVELVLLPDLPGHLAFAADWMGLAELCPSAGAGA